MKNYIRILAASLLFGFCKPCLAQDNPKGRFYVQPSVAYSQTDLKWSIAGNKDGKNPNVLSELDWRQLRGAQYGLDLKYHITNKLVAKVDFSIIDIASGHVTDSDYAQDDRQGVFYQELFKSNRGSDLSLTAAMGYTVLQLPDFTLSPFVGYELRRQNLFLLGQDGVAAQEALKSTYKNNWQGLVLGAAADLQVQRFALGLNLSASWLDYAAKANWNLIEAFQKPVSFRHNANAFSLHGQLKVGYALTKKFGVALNFGSIYAKALKGVDEAYYESRPNVQTQLNEVKSFSYSAGAGFSYYF